MDIYEKIEKLYQDNNTPQWAKQIEADIKEIKMLLQKLTTSQSAGKTDQNDDYYRFVNKFREKMKSDIENEIYPEVYFKGRTIGVNYKGYLYDKNTTNILPKHEAYELYKYFYEKRDVIDRYIYSPNLDSVC